jgi:dihydrofolate reductase
MRTVRELIVSEFVSVDGVMEAPGGEPGYRHAGWTFDGVASEPAVYEYKLEEALAVEALLLGRVTYEGFAAAWPGREDDAGFAARLNSMPKHVVTSTRTDLEWENSHPLPDLDAVRALRENDGGPLLVNGSRTLVRSLHEADLVDEWRLMVFPVVLGSGRRIFPDDVQDKRALALTQSRSFGNGVTLQVYRPTR